MENRNKSQEAAAVSEWITERIHENLMEGELSWFEIAPGHKPGESSIRIYILGCSMFEAILLPTDLLPLVLERYM